MDAEGPPPTPGPGDLPAFLPYACIQLCLEFDLKVTTVMEEEYVSKASTGDGKKRKSFMNNLVKRNQSTMRQSVMSAARSSSVVAEEASDSGDKFVRLICTQGGATGPTLAIDMDRNHTVPHELLRVLRMCVPYNNHLTRFSARWSVVDPAALYELVTLIPLSNITDVRLDYTHVCASDCRALLAVGRLRCLSLARCKLGDEGCIAVAEALAFPQPASFMLVSLSLAGNAIGDEGALAIARVLRSNRTLRLLDLSDNRLHDEGALAVLRTLAEFPLTLEEIFAARRVRMERALRLAEALQRCLRAGRKAQGGADEPRRRRLTRARLESQEELRELGPPLDPFPPEETVQRGGHLHSRGNMTLNCLNLAYNTLSVISVRALLDALRGQSASAGGLMRVQLIGNPLPECSPEYEEAAALMERALFAVGTPNKLQLKKKGR